MTTQESSTALNARWRIHLSGANPCEIVGTLELDATGSRVSARALSCGDQPWEQGGRRCAEAALNEVTAQSSE